MNGRVLLATLLCIASHVGAQTGHIRASLSEAKVCVQDQCVPALFGAATPTGGYALTHAQILAEGYGGDVLVYDLHRPVPLSIHRVWLGDPRQKRLERLRGPVAQRRYVSDGCINVAPEDYAWLLACCARGTLSIVQ